jgi:hypothetical protein
MEEYPMLMDQLNQYGENGCTTESHLYDQHNPYLNSNDILYQDGKVNLNIRMEAQMNGTSQGNPEK